MLWSLSLAPDARYLQFEARGNATGGVDGVFHSVDWWPKSITCVYEDGITQMMDRMWGNYLPSSKKLLTAYSLGPAGRGCVEVFPQSQGEGEGEAAPQSNDLFAASTPSDSGIREVVVGRATGKRDAWGGLDYGPAGADAHVEGDAGHVRSESR